MRELQELVIPLASHKWYEIGTALGVADHDKAVFLDELAAMDERNEWKFMKVLVLWLRGSKPGLQPSTWGCLLSILNNDRYEVQDAAEQVQAHIGVCI